ncbi:MAG: acyltransferase [Ruminococcaceae bacterium]|nr:acyltransferase [Oscillospiraceae bacterium]
MEKKLTLESQSGKRNIGVDLLRLVAVFMIVLLHVVRGTFPASSAAYIWCDAFLLGAFNVIALIAGYAYCAEKFNPGRTIRLWITGIFYGAVFYLITSAVKGGFSWTKFIKNFFPVLTGNSYFWFFAPYILLLLLVPVFNFAVEKLPRKGYLIGLCFFTVFFSLVQFAADPWGIADGRSILWLAYLYFIGAYFRKYGFPVRKWWANLCIFVCSSAATAGLFLLAQNINVKFWDPRYANYFHQYNCIFALAGAIALLALFAQLPIKESAEKTMRYFSAHSLGIYLSQSFLILYFIQLINHSEWNIGLRLVTVLGFSVCIFFAAFIIEAVRKLLFRFAKIDALTDLIGKKIQGKTEE